MSLWSSLLQTYDAVNSSAGITPLNEDVNKTLLPLYHTTLKTQLQVTLDENGYPTIKRDNADIEIIAPCTEQSMGRSGKVLPPHPLFDQLQYIDTNYDLVKHESYLSQLASWKGDNAKLNAIYQYLSQHSVIEEARAQGIGIDPKKDSKIGVRFAVHVRHGDYEPNVWADHAIRDLWIAHEEQVRHGASLGTDLFGETLYKPSTNFPKKIVNVNGNAKLISANDNTNFTFRGRFANRDEALSIDTLTSQKIHTTLRWLAANNGTLTGSQDIVIWAIDGHPTDNVLDPTGNSRDVAEQVDDRTDSEKLIDANVQTYANYAKQFGKLLRGYGNEKVLQQMQQHSRRIVVTIFDAATSGRLSVTFYRELSQNEYIESVLQWHEDAAWYLTCFDNKNSASTDDEAPRGSKKSSDKPKPIPYIGAPSFADVINCVYSTDDHSSDSYRRFAKYVKKQLVECMFSNAGLPASLLQPAFHKVIRPLSYDSLSVWQHDFEVACSMWKKYYIDQDKKLPLNERNNITMDLDEKRTDRDYLFGQLLALADNYEYRVLLRQSGGRTPDRTTNAVKLMNNFVAKPSTTWLTLRQQLNPYIISSTNGMFFQNEVDEVMSKFKEGDFESNKPLSSLFLLGYSHKRKQLIQRADAAKQLKEQNIEDKGE